MTSRGGRTLVHTSGKIALTDESGAFVRDLSAEEIFQVVVREERQLADGTQITERANVTCPGITFERMAADIRLSLALDESGRTHRPLSIYLTARLRDTEWTIADQTLPELDHFVKDSVWFAVRREELSAARELLSRAGAFLGRNVTDAYIRVVTAASDTNLVDDRVDPERFAAIVGKLRPAPGLRFTGTLRPYQTEGFNSDSPSASLDDRINCS